MMSRLMIAVVVVVILSTFVWVATRAPEQPIPVQNAKEQGSGSERLKHAIDSTAEQMKDAAHALSKQISNLWVTLKTKLSLFVDDRVRARDVHVTTRQDAIVLTGTVATEEARQAAEEAAAHIDSRRKVENHLVVVPKVAKRDG